jgi:tetratricopeptide (TPR) repeat protein
VSPGVSPLTQNAPLRRVAILCVLVCALILSCFQITNLDLGSHLAVGRQILKTHAIPDSDFFTHTIPGQPYPVHQWLGEVVAFAVDFAFGVPGLILLRMAIVLLASVVLIRHLRGMGTPLIVVAAIVLALLVAMRPRFFVRPFLVTLLFLPLLQSWVADVRSGRSRRLWPVLPLLTIWGHLHSGVLFGVLYLLGVLAGEAVKIAVSRFSHGPSRLAAEAAHPRAALFENPLDPWSFRRLALYSALGIALAFGTMALINPSGLRPLLLPFLFFRSQTLTGMIAEYRSVSLAIDWPFDLVAGLVLLGILVRPRRVDLTDLLVTAGFGILAYQAVRGIMPFAIASAPLLGRTWGAFAEDVFAWASRTGGQKSSRFPRANVLETVLLVLLLTGAAFVSVRAVQGWLFPFGFGKDPKHYPERALDFLEAQGIRGRIFNTDIWASSILWRWRGTTYPVFVDARLEVFPREFWRDVYYRVLQAAPGWQVVLDRYRVQFAFLRRAGGEADERIGEVLWEDPGWGLVYWDDYVMIFIRRDSPALRNQQILASWEFTSFHPRRPRAVQDLRGEALVRAEEELLRLTGWVPDSFVPRWALAGAWTALGDGQDAVDLYSRLAGRREARRNPAFDRAYADAALVAGNERLRLELLRKADVDAESPDELFHAASLLARAGQRENAVRRYRELLSVSPSHTDGMNNLALLLAESDEGIPEALELIERALSVSPSDPYYVASRGEILWRAGRQAEARAEFERALEQLPPEDTAARDEVRSWIERCE